jgi:hypothetical protein
VAPVLAPHVRAGAAGLLTGRLGIPRPEAERWVLTAEYQLQLECGWVEAAVDGSHELRHQWFRPKDTRHWEEVAGAARLAIDMALLEDGIDPAVFWKPAPAAGEFLPGEHLITAPAKPHSMRRPVLRPAILMGPGGYLIGAAAFVAPLYLVLAALHEDYTLVPDTGLELGTLAIAVVAVWAWLTASGVGRAASS